jgi:hypothetical protein
MNSAVVEIIPIEPCESKVVIVPLFEQSVEISTDTPAKPHTLSQALYLYAAGNGSSLLSVLEEDERACKFITQFKETWFVRTEDASEIGVSEFRELNTAVNLARTVQARRMAMRALDDCTPD